MRELEARIAQGDIVAARMEMARWYQSMSMHELLKHLPRATFAPGTREGIAHLQAHGVELAIASITWEFAVAWFARQLDIQYYLGTMLEPTGEIRHVWPRDKAHWVRRLATDLGISPQNVAAVGDSSGDTDLLLEATHAFFVGTEVPARLTRVIHLPNADISAVAYQMLEQFGMRGLRSAMR
jgi:phosphoserine phosphatase